MQTTIKLRWGVRGIGAQVLVSGGSRPIDTTIKKVTKKWQQLEERQSGQRGQGEERGSKQYHFVVQK